MNKKKFDVAVIGAGPGGYPAAIKLAQNGKTVCLIEKKYLGGSCLNVGCIPTKTLLANALIMHKLRRAEDYGIYAENLHFDYAKMRARKDGVIETIRKSLEGLLKLNKIEILSGTAEFLSPEELKVKGEENLLIQADQVIIATGSEPLDIPAFACDHEKILNSSSVLELKALPKSLAIIGGGYIGCEFASLFAEFGVKVTILEGLSSIVSFQGKTIADALTQAFKKKGIDVQTSVFVEGVDREGNGVSIRIKGQPSFQSDLALVSVGRKINSENLGLEKAGVKTGTKAEILVNDKLETSVPGIYAVGDVTGKFLLAHVATHQGLIAASNILGHSAKMHYHAVPAVIFTLPEIATVGMTLEEAQKEGYEATIGKFPFQVLGKSIASLDTEGFAQVVIDKKTGQILGAQVVGHDAATMISEMSLAIANELTIDCIADTIHAHPTTPEAWLEAALLANDTPLHFPPKKRSVS